MSWDSIFPAVGIWKVQRDEFHLDSALLRMRVSATIGAKTFPPLREAAFVPATKLGRLELAFCSLTATEGDMICRYLLRAHRLRSVLIESLKAPNAVVKKLVRCIRKLPHLREFDAPGISIYRRPHEEDDINDSLELLQKPLEVFVLHDGITASAVAKVCACKTLRKFELRYCFSLPRNPRPLPGLAGHTQLTTLDVCDNNFDDKQLCIVVKWASTAPALQCLFIGGNFMQTKAAKAVASLLGETKTLRLLEMAQCGLRSRPLSIVADAVRDNSALATLIMNNNYFGVPELETVFEAMASNRSITHLQLWHDYPGWKDLEPAMGKPVLTLLRKNHRLVRLDGFESLFRANPGLGRMLEENGSSQDDEDKAACKAYIPLKGE